MSKVKKQKSKPEISNAPALLRLLRKTSRSFTDSEAMLHNKHEALRIKIAPLVDDILGIIKEERIALVNEIKKITKKCPDPDNCKCIAHDENRKVCIHKEWGFPAYYIDEYLPYCPKEYDPLKECE